MVTLFTKTPDGLMEVTVGVGLGDGVTVSVCGRLVPPPGGAVITVTRIVPGPWTSSARTVAVSSFVLTKTVVRGTGAPPFTLSSTIELLPAKFLPITFSGKDGVPAATLVGETDLSTGFGLLMTC